MYSSKKELLKKINPKLLEITPKLTSNSNDTVDLDIPKDTLEEGAKKLMLRFFQKHEVFFKNITNEERIELGNGNYHESYRFCQSISERLSIPFISENEFNIDKPGKKFQDLKKKLEEEMSAKREENYKKRVDEYNKWKNKQTENSKSNFSLKDKVTGNKSSKNKSTDCEIKSPTEVMDTTSSHINNSFDSAFNESCAVRKNNDNMCPDDENISVTCENSITPDITKYANSNDDYNNGNNSEKNSVDKPCQNYDDKFQDESNETQESLGLPQNLLSPSLRFSLSESQTSKVWNEKCLETQDKQEDKALFSDKKFDLSDAYEYCSGKFPEADSPISSIVLNKHLSPFDKEPEENFNDTEIKNFSPKRSKKRILAFEDSDEDSDERSCDSIASNLDLENENVPHVILSDDEDETNKNSKSKIKKVKQPLYFSDEDEENNSVVEGNNSVDEENDSADEGNNSVDEENDSVDEENDSEINEDIIISKNKNKFINDPEDEEEYDEENYIERFINDNEEGSSVNVKEFFEKEAELSGSEDWSGDEDENDLDEFDEEAGDADDLDYSQIQSQLGKIHLRQMLNDDSKNVRLLQELFFEDGDLHSDNSNRFKWKSLAKLREEPEIVEDLSTKCEILDSSDDENLDDIQTRRDRLQRQLLFEKKIEEGELFADDLFKSIFQKLNVTTVKSQIMQHADNEKNENISTFKPRGSFLGKNEDLLSKLTKISAFVDNVRGPKNSRNFVFSTKSPEKAKSDKPEVKRSVEESNNSNFKKKLKLSDNTAYSVPSILDLIE